MVIKQKKDAFLDNCLCPYICSFLNATDLIQSRSVCSSWKNLYQCATHWIQTSCVPSCFLTQMVDEMKELIHCDVVVISKGRSWDLIIHPHEKLSYLKIGHKAQKKWDGGNCKIGPMRKLQTLEIIEAEQCHETFSSQFDYISLKTPQLDKLSVYNLFIPNHCIPSSISQLTMKTTRRLLNFGLQHYNLEHCTRLAYLCCISSMFQRQCWEILSYTIQYIYCDSFHNFGFYCPNLKWLCIAKEMETLPSSDFMEAFAQYHPSLQKLFKTPDSTSRLSYFFQRWTEKHNIELVNIRVLPQFKIAVNKECCEYLNES